MKDWIQYKEENGIRTKLDFELDEDRRRAFVEQVRAEVRPLAERMDRLEKQFDDLLLALANAAERD